MRGVFSGWRLVCFAELTTREMIDTAQRERDQTIMVLTGGRVWDKGFRSVISSRWRVDELGQMGDGLSGCGFRVLVIMMMMALREADEMVVTNACSNLQPPSTTHVNQTTIRTSPQERYRCKWWRDGCSLAFCAPSRSVVLHREPLLRSRGEEQASKQASRVRGWGVGVCQNWCYSRADTRDAKCLILALLGLDF
jgi:hypothetical protein